MKHITSIVILILLIGGFIALALFFTNRTSTERNAPRAEWDIATTIYPLYDIARQIAGDDLEIGLLLPPGVSSHTFEPSPALVQRMNEADTLFAIGHGLDDWALGLAHADMVVITVDAGIKLRENEEHDEDEDDHEDEEDDHGPIDPHYWLTAKNGIIIAQNIADALKNTYPEHADAMDARLIAYIEELRTADSMIQATIDTTENKQIVTLHDAWYYFADAYGLTIVGTYTPSVGKEPLPRDLAALAQIVADHDIRVLYSEQQTYSGSLQAFLEDYNLTVAALDEFGGTVNTQTYIDLLLFNAHVFAQKQ